MQTLQQTAGDLSDSQLNLVLTAAWDMLQHDGYPAITMAAISVHTGIKKNLLIRRWPKRSLLVREALIKFDQQIVTLKTPNSGNLQQDLIKLFNEMRPEINELSQPMFDDFIQEQLMAASPNQILSLASTGPNFDHVIQTILKRADRHHEINMGQLPQQAAALPELMLINQIVHHDHSSKKDLAQIVTKILMPVMTASKVKWI